MIIVSQDKDKILNYNNITQIYIGYAENNKKRSIRCETLTDTHVVLGKYETEERAKEVLQEIIKIYECCRNKDLKIYGYNTGNTYYMPKE